jgi:hypothetical protein
MNKKYTPALYFISNWIVIYSYLYIFRIFPYNPVILLNIVIIITIINIINILNNYNENTLLYYFIITNTLLKLPPLLMIYKDKIINSDIIFSVIFVMIYIIFMKIIDVDIIIVYKNYNEFILNKNNGKMSEIYYYIEYNNR